MLRFESVLAQKRIKLKQLGPFINVNHKPNIYCERERMLWTVTILLHIMFRRENLNLDRSRRKTTVFWKRVAKFHKLQFIQSVKTYILAYIYGHLVLLTKLSYLTSLCFNKVLERWLSLVLFSLCLVPFHNRSWIIG